MDRNQDGKLTKEEIGDSPISRLFDRLLENGDKNRDGALTLPEIKDMPPPPMPPAVASPSITCRTSNSPTRKAS